MIKKGVPLFKQFKSLSRQELVDLFLEITQWPEYLESNFRAASSVLFKQRGEEEGEEDEYEFFKFKDEAREEDRDLYDIKNVEIKPT